MQRPRILILMPVFNDWAASRALIQNLDQVSASENWDAEVVVIDDGSNDPGPTDELSLKSIQSVDVLRLKRNLGHQRAICIGLAYVDANRSADYVVVMDGDGQDGAADIPALLNRTLGNPDRPVVFAERQRRSESLVFQFFYAIYRYAHFLLTGHRVRVGNFSVLPFSRLQTLCLFPDLWNHYAATVFKSRLPRTQVPIDRRYRSEGNSRMNFVGLVVHGLSAISVFGETIGVRLLIFSGLLAVLAAMGGLVVAVIRFTTEFAIPGWATYAMLGMVIVGIQSLLLMLVFVFVILSARNGSVFLPSRDHIYFIGEVEPWRSEGLGAGN